MKTEVLIVGAGIIGLSVAYNLAEKGCKVAVAEKEFPGAGTTGKGGGGIRHQFSTELNIKLTIESLKILRRFKDITGYDPQLKQISYYLLATRDEEEILTRSVQAQSKLGLHSILIEPKELKQILQGIKIDDIAVASTCEEDAWINPSAILQGYQDSSKRLGVKILEQTEVHALKIEKDHLRAAATSEAIDAECVVIAAGAYSAPVARSLGVELPINPFKRQVFYVEGFRVAKRNCVLFDMHHKVAFVNRDEGAIVGVHDRSVLGSFDETLNLEDVPYVKEVAAHRIPHIKEAEITGGIAGLYEVTPDRNPILGPIPNIKGLLISAGFSGHGIMHAPIIGKIMAEMILGGKSSIDVSQFSLNRFKENRQIYEHIVI